jgi:hypothetical protein
MSAIRTQGIKLSYKAGEASAYTVLTDCISLPELGGSKDKIEITTLDSTAHEYINGLDNYGDSLDFQFLYKDEQFNTLRDLKGVVSWKITLPSPADMNAVFSGECAVRLDAIAGNDKVTYTLGITPSSAIEFKTAAELNA